MSKKYRIGIVGIGAIAGMHARAIGDLPNAELVGGCCRTKQKGLDFCKQFGGNWYATAEQLLDTEKPDVIAIATPSGAHLDPTLAAAKRGVHVLCEKPLEISTERCDAMAIAAAEAGITLGGIFPQRFNGVVKQVQSAAAAGRFGSLSVVNCYVPWWRDDAYYGEGRWQGTLALDGGGALMNQSIHGVDAMQWFAASAGEANGGGPVEQVFAFTAKRAHDPKAIEVEDTCVAVVRFKGGALGQILAATSMWPGDLRRLQMAGREGFAEIREDELLKYDFTQSQSDDDAIREKYSAASKTQGGASDPMAIDYSHHTANIAAFLDALDGKTPLMLDAAEARKAVAIIEAIYESARTGKVVYCTDE